MLNWRAFRFHPNNQTIYWTIGSSLTSLWFFTGIWEASGVESRLDQFNSNFKMCSTIWRRLWISYKVIHHLHIGFRWNCFSIRQEKRAQKFLLNLGAHVILSKPLIFGPKRSTFIDPDPDPCKCVYSLRDPLRLDLFSMSLFSTGGTDCENWLLVPPRIDYSLSEPQSVMRQLTVDYRMNMLTLSTNPSHRTRLAETS